MKTRYSVQVKEINEIAGESVVCNATVSLSKTLYAAREFAIAKWNGKPPVGSRIVDTKGVVYDIPQGVKV